MVIVLKEKGARGGRGWGRLVIYDKLHQAELNKGFPFLHNVSKLPVKKYAASARQLLSRVSESPQAELDWDCLTVLAFLGVVNTVTLGITYFWYLNQVVIFFTAR